MPHLSIAKAACAACRAAPLPSAGRRKVAAVPRSYDNYTRIGPAGGLPVKNTLPPRGETIRSGRLGTEAYLSGRRVGVRARARVRPVPACGDPRVMSRRTLRGRSVICQAPHRGSARAAPGSPRAALRQGSPRAGPRRPARPAPPCPRPAPRRCVCVRTPPESPDACARRADSGASRVLAGRLAACCYTDARKNRPHRGTRRRGT